MKYDFLIIGAGPGGISAALELKSSGYNVAIIEASMPGGKVNIAPRVDNYPGFNKISGPDLAMHFFMKMNEAHIEMIPTRVNKLIKEDDAFILETPRGNYEAHQVIIASGTDEKKLGLTNEQELLGHGLSYCAVCDGHFFKGQTVAVVAEDKYAINEAIYLAPICKEVIVITSQDKLVGTTRSIDELKTYKNVKYIFNNGVKALKGNPLSSIILNDNSELTINGIFPLLGYIPNTQYLAKSLLDEDGFVKVNRSFETAIPGLYAIGDVISRELKQIYLAVNDAKILTRNIKSR